MPIYEWKDKNTDKTVRVKRPIAELERAPDKEEALEAGFSITEFAEAVWERILNLFNFTGPKGKGNW